MKTGDEVQVRNVFGGDWVQVRIEIISANQQSLAVSASEGLATQVGFTLDPATGLMVLVLFKEGQVWTDLYSGTKWEVIGE